MTDESNNQNSEKKESEKAEKPSIDVSPKLAKIIEEIETLSVLELADLVKSLEDKFGVSATAMAVAPVASGNGAEGGDAESAEEKTEFDVVLTETGASKISVIKAVRELVPSLGLKDAKDLVESAPKPVLEGVGKDSANEAKAKLETAGAKAELK